MCPSGPGTIRPMRRCHGAIEAVISLGTQALPGEDAPLSSTSSHPADITRERLIAAHLPPARAAARRYAGAAESFDDLVPDGAIGLLKAADRFAPRRRVAC